MMGVGTRRPMLPAPTESIVDTNTTTGDSAAGTDLATDVSRRTDKTSYSIPDDGSPVVIPTRRRHRDRGDDSKLSRSSHHSQTSLLIEYFEGGKGSGGLVSRPSVRVRVTPSSARKSKEQKDHRIHITEGGERKPIYSRRISLSSPSKHNKQRVEQAAGDDLSIGSSDSATDDNQQSSRHPPLEIEFVNRDQASELSSRYIHPTSDISSMPADSMLEASSSGPRRKRSQSIERDSDLRSKDLLKTPTRQRSRSLSHERIAHRVAEKLSSEPREASANRYKRSEKRGMEKDYLEPDARSPRRRLHDDDMASPESSLLSASAVSSRRKSGDQYSIRSGASNKSSLNNPKLLETVEDAIRRLILPELKELKKDQKVNVNKARFERDLNASYSSAGPPSRDELGRRLSKHASAPDVRKPKVVLNKDSKDEGIVLADDTPPKKTASKSSPKRRERKSSRDSDADSYIKWANRPELSEQEKLRRQRSKGLRDAEKAGIVGTALTAAALHRHESMSSLDQDENRRGSESRSRAGSMNETELVFKKHNVAPMPLHSAIDSEMTRDSLVSQRSDNTATPPRNSRALDMSPVSPLHVASPTSRTPNRSPLDTRHEFGLRHSNMSNHNLSIHSASDNDLHKRSLSPLGDAAAGAIAAAAAANLLDPRGGQHDGHFTDMKRRTLSPIQSVTSDLSDAHAKHPSATHDTYEHSEGEKELEPRLSIDSLSSAPSTDLARSTRAGGMSAESQIEILRHQKEAGYELGYEESPRRSRENWNVEYGDEDESAYRHSMAESSDGAKRSTNYTDDSEIDFLERANQRQQVADGVGVNPEFVHPMAVESAVASLLDPSTILDTKSAQSANRSQTNLPEQLGTRSMGQPDNSSRQGSPLKQRQDAASPDATSFPKRMGATSPPQSVTQSIDDQIDPTHMFPADMRDLESPLPEDDRDLESESEINTNPSIIQGPIGAHESKDHWAYNATPPKLFDNADIGVDRDIGLEPDAQPGYGQDYYPADTYEADNYFDPDQMYGTPPGIKDEGYVSAPNPLSPSAGSGEPGSKGLGGFDAGMGLFDSPTGADDPFGASHRRNVSGYSHGIGSPLYDSATGRGIDRIQSQDIVALMDHLTVRDAQRNARDTEILVSLVRSAAEMRTSFEEMKKFISQQDGMILDASDRQHDRTYKALGGPRPLPASGLRASRQTAADEEDLRSKRKNVFKRALKGLSLKSGSDLARIEEMLEQLLDEVETLRAGQEDMRLRSSGGTARALSVDTEGYEPEGKADTGSPGQSGYLSNSSRPDPRANGVRRDSENRVSTVHETDEDMELGERGEFLSPHLVSRENPKPRQERAEAAGPVTTPPRAPAVASGALSNETTPKNSGEKARKHKSSSSSFFPKISRWSKTTASSMGDNIRNSMQPGRKDRNSFDASRSGDLNVHYKTNNDWYDPQGDDKIRSTYTLDDDHQQENRPPSPLVPSQVSEAPKYQAHRDSLDLQHPQPRQGPTGRYQTQLETQAQAYGVEAGYWGSNPSLSGANANRLSGPTRLSPISDAGYSETSSRRSGPPRPPKIRDEGPLIPERPPKVKEEESQSYASRVASRSSAMRSPHNTPPTRKPTGPRPLNSGSQYSSPGTKRSRYRGSPDQVDDDID